MPLPPDLLGAIAHPGGGRVVLVVGAGCSFEAPTSLPLADECARDAHRRLRADGVLTVDCTDPTDLSCVADAVLTATGSQRDLVARLQPDRFRHAVPNEGYLLAAAMLRERVVSCIMTLNFDLAMSSALTQLGAHSDVSEVAGPEDHANLGAVNLIYLHRNANADWERWILRSSALENEWRGEWREVITARVIGAPVTVFVGLGTPAAVLVESATRIREAIPTEARVRVYQVDPGERESSEFFARLGLPPEAYLRMGWVSFMRRLGGRVVEEHRAELETACNEFLAEGEWETEDVAGLCMRLASLGLLGYGQVRARWLLNDRAYIPRSEYNVKWIADLLLAVGLIERITQSQMIFGTDGIIDFRRGDRILGSVILAHAQGVQRWAKLEVNINRSTPHRRNHHPQPRCAVVAGVPEGRPAAVAPPKNITIEEDETSVVTGNSDFEIFSVDELRQNPELTSRMLN